MTRRTGDAAREIRCGVWARSRSCAGLDLPLIDGGVRRRGKGWAEKTAAKAAVGTAGDAGSIAGERWREKRELVAARQAAALETMGRRR